MKIQVLNKNLDTADVYTSAHIFDVDEAPVLTDVKNETLDSGTVILNNLEKQLEIEPYDIIAIYNDNNVFKKYLCVDTYREQITCVNPRLYRYEITLFSETKQLEGIILPNLKITKVLNDPQTRSVYDYINQYLEEYSPKIRTITSGTFWSGDIDYKWRWTVALDENHQRLQDKFNVVCPEMQWNTPTLREVLNDLMMVVDCIPIIKNGIISYVDLTEITNKDWSDDTNHINYVTRSKSSEDYVSEIQSELVNVTNNINNANNYVTVTEYKAFGVQDNEVILKDSNLLLRTNHPIYRIKKLIMCFVGTGNTSDGTLERWIEFDLCSIPGLVSEYQEWITKEIAYNTAAPSTLQEFGLIQNWSLYYTRNSREISNFSSKTKYVWFTNNLIEELPKRIIRYKYPEVVGGEHGGEYYQYLFKIEYETLEGCMFRASKGEYPDNERVIIDNQTNSYVDSYSQGFLEYQKANRLGNEQLQINARFSPEEDTIEIGDSFDDCVVYQVQKQYFKNHTEVNALATKNYILREYFTGVKSKIRSWAVVSGSEALTRHDLQKFYCEFSYDRHQDLLESSASLQYYNRYVSDYLISPFKGYDSKPVKYCFVRSYAGYWIPPVYTGNEFYCIDLINRIIGNSLVFTFKFLDNYWVGQSFDSSYVNTTNMNASGALNNDAYVNGGLPIQQNRYTDSAGECYSLEITLGNGFKVTGTANTPDLVDNQESVTENQIKLTESCTYRKPVVREGNLHGSGYENRMMRISTFHQKDSQEILNQSIQFEFSSDTKNICFSKKWLERQELISLTDNYHNFFIRVYDKSSYNFRNPNELPSTGYTDYNVTLDLTTFNNYIGRIEIRIPLLSSNTLEGAESNLNNLLDTKCVYLLNSDNEILMAFNEVPSENRKVLSSQTIPIIYTPYFDFYLNLLRSRNKNIYDSENHYLIVGHI